MDIVKVNAYVNLASAIVLQAYKDIDNWHKEEPVRQRRKERTGSDNMAGTSYVPKADFISATEFIKTDECKYLLQMVIDWKYLYDQINKRFE